jgi:hypothetical protein
MITPLWPSQWYLCTVDSKNHILELGQAEGCSFSTRRLLCNLPTMEMVTEIHSPDVTATSDMVCTSRGQLLWMGTSKGLREYRSSVTINPEQKRTRHKNQMPT